MAQNENISLSLANKVDILNKSQSVDARYGVYDTEEDALDAMALYGLDGRQVAVYSDKVNGKVRLYLYNEVLHQLEPISGVEVEWYDISGDQSDVNISGFTNDSGFITINDIPSGEDTSLFDDIFIFNSDDNPDQEFELSFLPYQIVTVLDNNQMKWLDDGDYEVNGQILKMLYPLENETKLRINYYHKL